MFDQIAYYILRGLLVLTVFVVFFGIGIGDTLIRKK